MLIFILCVENDHLGRINPSMLTQQQRAELFFTPDNPQKARADLGGNEDDACSWFGFHCDQSGKMKAIALNIAHIYLKGSVQLSMLPLSLTSFNLYEQQLSGEVDVTALPPNLGVMFVYGLCMWNS